MIKLKSITYKNHPVLGSLYLDFTKNGKPVDTIILAGENGVGKSRILNSLNAFSAHNAQELTYISEVELDIDGKYEKIVIDIDERGLIYFNIQKSNRYFYLDEEFNKKIPFKAIYSDVAINYDVPQINAVTSLNLDEIYTSIKTSKDTAKDVAQLLIDVATMDGVEYQEVMEAARAKGEDLNTINIELRMNRFIYAFDQMFTHIKWGGIKNISGQKKVLFRVYDNEVDLNDLSSGEKQIIFRGGQLLKNQNMSDGAFILIDEPEISLHPEWQKKIMSYYKNIFTDSKGKQFSQIFAVTHSPFIIHNNNRYNDKIIVLKRNDIGQVIVDENASYYDIGDVRLIEDAFNIDDFSTETKSTVYVEGITDEQYLKSVIKTFDFNVDFEIKWIGNRKENEKGKDKDTGCTALKAASNVLSKMPFNNMVLYDWDTNKGQGKQGTLFIKTLKEYPNSKLITVGIENALVLDDIDMSIYYDPKISIDKQGGKHINEELKKQELCDDICRKPLVEKQRIYANLKNELEEIIGLFRYAKNEK